MKPSSTTGTRRAAPARIDADEPGDLEAAERGQHAEGVAGIAAVHGERPPHRLDLAGPRRRRHPGAAAGDLAGSAPVSAAVSALAAVVLPMPISPVPTQSGAASLDERRARLDRPGRPRRASSPGPRVMFASRPPRGGGRSPRWSASGAATPKSATTTRAPAVAGEHVDRGAAPREVLDHLRGDRLRIGAHALGDDAVVGGEREDHRRLDPRHAARP